MQQKLSADSAVVQAIVEDFVMMYAGPEQFRDKAAFFRQYAHLMQTAPTERIERFNKLCLLLNPKWDVIVRGNALLMEGLEWKLAQEEFSFRTLLKCILRMVSQVVIQILQGLSF